MAADAHAKHSARVSGQADTRPQSDQPIPSPPSACGAFAAPLADTELSGSVGVGSLAFPLEDCCTACVNDAACLGFVEFQSMCYLKGGTLSQFTLSGRITYLLAAAIPPPPAISSPSPFVPPPSPAPPLAPPPTTPPYSSEQIHAAQV